MIVSFSQLPWTNEMAMERRMIYNKKTNSRPKKMAKLNRTSGWANPRAKPFVGGRVHLTKLYQLYGAKIGQFRARRNQGSLLGFPPILQLQTKSGCNASCVFCPQKKIRGIFPEVAMSDGLFHKIVEQCAETADLHGVGFVLQNEPLTDPSLFDKIRYFRRHVKTKAMTFITTNGTLLAPQVVDVLLDSGLDAMHISCNGFGKEDFEAINQGKSWEVFRENIEKLFLRDLSKIAVMMSFVRSNLYKEDLEKAIRYWRSRGIHCFIHGINNRGGIVDDYGKYARPMEKEKFSVRARKRAVKGFLRCCPYPFLQMSVLASGKCLICTHDWGRRQVIGDLNEQTVTEVWNGPMMRDLRLRLLAGRAGSIPSCKHCDVFENAAFA